MSHNAELPNIAEVLAPILSRVPRDQQPLLIAMAERLAAERYRGWATQVSAPDRRSGLLACAAGEEEIAARIEALYPDAASMQRDLLEAHPDLPEISRALFAPFALAEQFALQAQGERIGAATWRAFAKADAQQNRRDIFLACALLEERSAEFLESILRSD